MKFVLVLAIAVAVSLAQGADPQIEKGIQGKWTPTKAELSGKPMNDAILKTISLTMANGRWEVIADGKPDKGTYTVDATTSPAEILIKGTEGPNQGKTFPAIFELHPDTLRICYDLSGKQKPDEFKSTQGTRLYLVTYKRQN